ncbi:hypothetical protein BDY21DRAFT_99255 [Lineolata rhizophorae]|uniref:DNA repair metallo-beta-lactamase domain-containing protein n=1 Tax=Lineolata rhizophorae TaxID=578093 RepID=A0A6A6NS30_9PEZI|nr:hypothetical protein BDY21DRAFT_99255 [Lineolata rhizophorae]
MWIPVREPPCEKNLDETTKCTAAQLRERCNVLPNHSTGADVVYIMPIVTRPVKGGEMQKLGAGGEKGNLDQVRELVLSDASAVRRLIELCREKLRESVITERINRVLTSALEQEHHSLRLDEEIRQVWSDAKGDETDIFYSRRPIQEVVQVLRQLASTRSGPSVQQCNHKAARGNALYCKEPGEATSLPREITLPFSRHSSYEELIGLGSRF